MLSTRLPKQLADKQDSLVLLVHRRNRSRGLFYNFDGHANSGISSRVVIITNAEINGV